MKLSPAARKALQNKRCPVTGRSLEDGSGHLHPAHQVGMKPDEWEKRAEGAFAKQAATEAEQKAARIAALEAELRSLKGEG